MMRTGEEVPYAVAVEIQQFDESRREGNRKKPGIVDIEATIHVEREGQKAIVVGKGGEMVRDIGTAARPEIERVIGAKCMLELRVKTQRGWRDDPALLDRLGP